MIGGERRRISRQGSLDWNAARGQAGTQSVRYGRGLRASRRGSAGPMNFCAHGFGPGIAGTFLLVHHRPHPRQSTGHALTQSNSQPPPPTHRRRASWTRRPRSSRSRRPTPTCTSTPTWRCPHPHPTARPPPRPLATRRGLTASERGCGLGRGSRCHPGWGRTCLPVRVCMRCPFRMRGVTVCVDSQGAAGGMWAGARVGGQGENSAAPGAHAEIEDYKVDAIASVREGQKHPLWPRERTRVMLLGLPCIQQAN